MGGKNAIIIDEDADLDEAVQGVIESAFGYSGQKCSACSRVIVLKSVYDAFVNRLTQAAESIEIGPADAPGSFMGPVIDQEAFDRIQSYIAIGSDECETILARDVGKLSEKGFFVGPHIFANVDPESRLAQHEVFGPVLAIMQVDNLADALTIANNTDYALTGGMYSRSPKNLDRCAAGVRRWQSVLESIDHRCARPPSPVWRVSHVRHRHQGRRPRLPAPVLDSGERVGKHHAARIRSRI